MKTVSYLTFVAGLALATGLIVWQGAGEIMASLAEVGVAMLLLAPMYMVPLSLDTLGWRRLIAPGFKPVFGSLVRALWIGVSVNWLLPVAQIGGEFAKARLLVQHAVPGHISGASVVTDKTVQAMTQVIYGLVGLCLLALLQTDANVLKAVLGTAAVFSLLLFGFYRAQRAGLFRFLAAAMARFAKGEYWLKLVGGAEALDQAILDVYGRRWDFVACCAWRMVGRVVMVGEVWVALYLLGHPVSIVEAIMLDSLGQAVRGVAFLIPGALGVQEGSYLLLGQLIGLGPEVMLSMSLMKRVRELLVGVPALIVWQIGEGRFLWRRSRVS